MRLTLDVSSVLGVSMVTAVGDGYVDLADPVMTRTGYLAGARLVAGSPDHETVLAEVLDAANLDGQRTRLWLGPAGPLAPTTAVQTASAGQRVALVDYAVGDILGP